MLEAGERVPTMVAWAVRSYGYAVAVLDQEGQIIEMDTVDAGRDRNETARFARLTARQTAEEHGIALGKGNVYQHQELLPTTAEVEAIP